MRYERYFHNDCPASIDLEMDSFCQVLTCFYCAHRTFTGTVSLASGDLQFV